MYKIIDCRCLLLRIFFFVIWWIILSWRDFNVANVISSQLQKRMALRKLVTINRNLLESSLDEWKSAQGQMCILAILNGTKMQAWRSSVLKHPQSNRTESGEAREIGLNWALVQKVKHSLALNNYFSVCFIEMDSQFVNFIITRKSFLVFLLFDKIGMFITTSLESNKLNLFIVSWIVKTPLLHGKLDFTMEWIYRSPSPVNSEWPCFFLNDLLTPKIYDWKLYFETRDTARVLVGI